MPLYQNPERRDQRLPESPNDTHAVMHRTSEESIRTEFCEGPLPDDHVPSDMDETSRDSNADSPEAFRKLPIRDRAELIERIKRSQAHPWRPESPSNESPARLEHDEAEISPRNTSLHAPLLPAIELKGPMSPEQAAQSEEPCASNLHAGLEIQRPRSALHAGDFTETSTTASYAPQAQAFPEKEPQLQRFARGPSLDALSVSPSIAISKRRRPPLPSSPPHPLPERYLFESTPLPARSRVPSFHSRSSSFVFKAPTSPLVQQENNDDEEIGLASTPDSSRDNRRRTLPADGFQYLRSLPSTLAQAARQPASFQVDVGFSMQSREARRSATFGNHQFGSLSPPTPGFLRSRRTSVSGDVSPLQPSSMVGSYEESILRGRMSTTPSKPVDFTAQIGALGKADCKPRFPDHVTLSFPAVYYNWSSAESATSSEPSPYVGQIDLENGLPPPKRKERKSRRSEKQPAEGTQPADGPSLLRGSPERSRRAVSPSKRPPGGSYRIPQQGHLQILIKNPNKTAVKLFFIPYDLQGMEPGTKTFIRQNSYSAGPIIEALVTTRAHSESALDIKTPTRSDRPKLRYSIHLHICCPTKGRYYLYKEIKVVFANRVPDNKERLQNEIRLPEPRFSLYRPSSEIRSSSSMASLRGGLERENRRRSFQVADQFDGPILASHRRFPSLDAPGPSDIPSVPPVPDFARLTSQQSYLPALVRRGAADAYVADVLPQPPSSSQSGGSSANVTMPQIEKLARTTSDLSGSLRSNSSNASSGGDSAYSKLSKGDVGYGGLFARPGTPEYSEGLLSRRLRAEDPPKATSALYPSPSREA